MDSNEEVNNSNSIFKGALVLAAAIGGVKANNNNINRATKDSSKTTRKMYSSIKNNALERFNEAGTYTNHRARKVKDGVSKYSKNRNTPDSYKRTKDVSSMKKDAIKDILPDNDDVILNNVNDKIKDRAKKTKDSLFRMEDHVDASQNRVFKKSPPRPGEASYVDANYVHTNAKGVKTVSNVVDRKKTLTPEQYNPVNEIFKRQRAEVEAVYGDELSSWFNSLDSKNKYKIDNDGHNIDNTFKPLVDVYDQLQHNQDILDTLPQYSDKANSNANLMAKIKEMNESVGLSLDKIEVGDIIDPYYNGVEVLSRKPDSVPGSDEIREIITRGFTLNGARFKDSLVNL